MVSNIITVLALASAVVAHPQRHRPWQHWGTDRLSAAAAGSPTDAPVAGNGQNNGSNFAGSPAESPSVTDVRTVTVQPIPVASADAPGLSSIKAPAAVGPVEQDSSTCITSTLTATTVELVTVTAGLAPQQTVSSVVSNNLAQLAPETSVSLEAASVTAGAFYNRPTYGGGDNTWNNGGGVPSSAAPAVPTTFATAVSSAPPAGASSAAPVSSSVPPSTGGGGGGSSSGGKKGLSYNDASLTNAFAGKGISWAYNWAAGPGGSILPGVEFVPMLWGEKSVSAWAGAAASAIAAGAKHALSLNEPDHTEQANLDPQTAAKVHIANMNPLAGQVSIGSPAVTNGAAPMGIAWLQNFFDACGGQCKVDFVTFHWYDSASNFAYFQKHVQDVISLAAANGVSKVWLTEYGATGSDSDVASFIKQSTAFLDSTPAVERYAYFMVQNGILTNGNSLSSLGTAYTS
ncbi:hypothetical protein LTR84_008240 [Exophiala bonariae]|uniref:Asl1-like glycosyl hydrolase catalytic domain-containing protein n=1 Tax=Exophiala bonariae TaxID=1690606 RepID=A0AAV9MXL5_9EURO|nr:hypothetical protein LTR84_008240 [Exophiala bonariae]